MNLEQTGMIQRRAWKFNFVCHFFLGRLALPLPLPCILKCVHPARLSPTCTSRGQIRLSVWFFHSVLYKFVLAQALLNNWMASGGGSYQIYCNYQSLDFKSAWKFELVPYYQLQVVRPDADMCCTRQMKLKLQLVFNSKR